MNFMNPCSVKKPHRKAHHPKKNATKKAPLFVPLEKATLGPAIC